MIRAKQIPDEVVQELIATLYGKPGLPYREAIAAAINAWPGAFQTTTQINRDATEVLILPLTENTNAES